MDRCTSGASRLTESAASYHESPRRKSITVSGNRVRWRGKMAVKVYNIATTDSDEVAKVCLCSGER